MFKLILSSGYHNTSKIYLQKFHKESGGTKMASLFSRVLFSRVFHGSHYVLYLLLCRYIYQCSKADYLSFYQVTRLHVIWESLNRIDGDLFRFPVCLGDFPRLNLIILPCQGNGALFVNLARFEGPMVKVITEFNFYWQLTIFLAVNEMITKIS